MSTRLQDYDYALPRELIAQRPLPGRGQARMMILRRVGQTIEHGRFLDLPQLLSPGDIVVLNDSRVLPARHFSDDEKFEFLFLRKLSANRWQALVRPAKKFARGACTRIKGMQVEAGDALADGTREIIAKTEADFQRTGAMPLPPYIARRSDEDDVARYQTVFAACDGSIAAPTAGLHFTPEVLAKIPHAFITLHVGTGTFRPVKNDNIAQHQMHSESFSISADAAKTINAAQRVVAVGTTAARVLESAFQQVGKIAVVQSETSLFIYPPFKFRIVDGLLTNFHLPRSTLLMLVSAFAGREFILRAYAEAVRQRYRFFSYGDCMLIL